MPLYKSVADVIKLVEYWLRLSIFLHEPLKCALLRILHNTSNRPDYYGLPDNPTDLYNELHTKYQGKINKLHRKGVLQNDQIELIFPPGDTKTFSDKFDVTLIVVLIRNCTTLKPPLNGWADKYPPANDKSISANAIRAREWRNYVHHTDPNDIDLPTFNQKWAEGSLIISDLGYMYDTNKLKTISLDPKCDVVLKSLFSFIARLQKQYDSQAIKIAQIQQDNAYTQQDVRDTRQDVSNTKQDVSNTQQDVSNIKQDINSIQQNIKKNATVEGTEIENIRRQVLTIENEVNNLQASVKGKYIMIVSYLKQKW